MHPIYKKLKTVVKEASLNSLDDLTTRILLKEYLQTHLLFALYNSLHGQHLIFYGGTALRKIYGLDRMSEDLDFVSNRKLDLQDTALTVKHYFNRLKFTDLDFKIQTGKLISRITFKFPILFNLGLSAMPSEKLHLKIEINFSSSAESFATEASSLKEDQIAVMIKHYRLPVLMAGKITACLDRVFKKGNTDILVKGRDFYDLIWYMEKQVLPDEKYLTKSGYRSSQIWSKLDKKVKTIKPYHLIADLKPFFTSFNYTKTWSQNFHSLYSRYRQFYNKKL